MIFSTVVPFLCLRAPLFTYKEKDTEVKNQSYSYYSLQICRKKDRHFLEASIHRRHNLFAVLRKLFQTIFHWNSTFVTEKGIYVLAMAEMKIQEAQTYKGIKWQVIILFSFSWLCHSVSAHLDYFIAEELRKDSFIANIANDLGLDVKDLSPQRFRIVSRAAEKYFYVDIKTGILYVKDRIDRETLCRAEATCAISFDAVTTNPLNVSSVTIQIEDINDNPPRFFPDSINLEVVESTSQGIQLSLQKAEDPDTGNNSIQTYTLSDNLYFTLRQKTNKDMSKSPVLVLEKPLDRETQTIHELILTASDGGNPTRTGTALIRIIVTDVNDNIPIFSQEVYKVSISENTPINTTVICVNAADKDEGLNAQITYFLGKTSENSVDTEMFTINPKNGEIKTIKHLNFEEIRNYEISIQAKDGGGFVAHSKVLIEIIDENDNLPEISITSITSPVPEDSVPGTVIALVEVHDQDSGENGEVDCQILGTAHFQLVSSSSRYYRIITASALDREKISSYDITVAANDRGSPHLSTRKIIRLNVSDVNDNAPVFMKSKFDAYLAENNLPGASIYCIFASDLDIGENAKVIYSISSKNTEDFPVSSYFSINIETGVLYAQRSFDYEQHKEFQMEITAKDNGFPPLSSNATLFIHITDQNDNAPKILYPSSDGGYSFFDMVSLASEQGTLITKVVAADSDSGHNSWLSYNFIQVSEPLPFIISQHNGEIRTLRMFQEKDSLKYKVVVLVKDNGEPSLSATVTLSLVVAEHFQQVIPKSRNLSNEEESQSNLQMYLIIAVALISLLFILTVVLVILSKCKESEPSSDFGVLSSNLYSQVDPRLLSKFNTGTLPLPYSYNVCVALDSSEGDFTFIKPDQNVPIDNLIDADDSGFGNGNLKDTLSPSNAVQAPPNADWHISQAQRPGPSGAQPAKESGVWPNNQFETERLQAMILASANEAAEGSSALGGGTGTMGLSARYGPQFTLQHLPDYRQNIYIPGTTSTLTNAAGKGKSAAPSGGNKKKSGKKDKK
ncbi:protocadherin gamma-B1 isoform X2 [Xenopus laevis]|uniref:Protocadherin gamma-B1 isoform X2 n=1 Tax=Xenopus laevis TaxID=8355 RepID=A0A8J1MKU8_XENLA|nr:protocadherin gamma-B1 isoform X2 [Xenopus laevis]